MKPHVYITRRIPDEVCARIAERCTVEMWEDTDIPVPVDILHEQIKQADGLYCMLTDRIDLKLLQQAERLKVISSMSVGYNHIDLSEASKRGIIVTNTPDVLTETTADLTFALLMAVARRIVESSQFLREGRWRTWSPMLLTGQDIYGSTLGIVGMGRIGQALARRAAGFGMRTLYFNRTRKPDVEAKLGIDYMELDDLLVESDYICIMTPYTAETHGLIGRRELKMMKRSSVLVNTARGGIVDEQALYEALVTGEIWGAGLDVFEEEPIRVDHPLLTLPNVVALPHIGSASIATRMQMAELAADNLLGVFSGETPVNQVHPEDI